MKSALHTAPGTAARIRDAAIAEFAANGFSQTTVRAIAAAADVSPGLVIHHFGSKDGLRTACDDYVFEAVTETKRENAGRSPEFLAEMFSEGPMRTNTEYLLKSLLDPSEHGQRFFDHYVELVEQIILEGFAGYRFRTSDDLRAQATLLAMLALAPGMLEHRARKALDTNDLSGSMARLAPEIVELYVNGYIESVRQSQPAPGPQAAPGRLQDSPTLTSEQTSNPTVKEDK